MDAQFPLFVFSPDAQILRLCGLSITFPFSVHLVPGFA
jgi:hypothetical protein